MRIYTLAVVGLLAVSAPGIAVASDDTEHVSRTFKMAPGGTLRLKSFSGRVTITGSDRSEIVIEAVRRAPRERLDRIKLDIRESDGIVTVDANRRERSWYEFGSRSNVVETDFDIAVPTRTHLDVSVFSAPVTIERVEGSQKVYSFSSTLTLNDVVGSIRAHTFSGPVAIREKAWTPNQTIDVHTFSGSIELHVPDDARGDVSFNSFSGQLNSDVPLTLHSSNRRRVTAELGGGGSGTLTFKTFSGSVKINR